MTEIAVFWTFPWGTVNPDYRGANRCAQLEGRLEPEQELQWDPAAG